jgi:hypothetical protein
MREPNIKILELKRRLQEARIDDTNLVYMPLVPIIGHHEFYLEEEFGMKVAKLISAPND